MAGTFNVGAGGRNPVGGGGGGGTVVFNWVVNAGGAGMGGINVGLEAGGGTEGETSGRGAGESVEDFGAIAAGDVGRSTLTVTAEGENLGSAGGRRNCGGGGGSGSDSFNLTANDGGASTGKEAETSSLVSVGALAGAVICRKGFGFPSVRLSTGGAPWDIEGEMDVNGTGVKAGSFPFSTVITESCAGIVKFKAGAEARTVGKEPVLIRG